MGVQILLS